MAAGPSGDELRDEGGRFAEAADVEEVGGNSESPGDEEEYVTQQWALQDRDPPDPPKSWGEMADDQD